MNGQEWSGKGIDNSDCEACREDLSAVLLGIASEAEAERVQAHLQTCATCQREAAELRQVLGGVLQAAPEIAPPAELRARVLNSARSSNLQHHPIPQSAPRKRPNLALWLPTSLGLAAAVAAFVLWPQPAPTRADVVVSAGDSVVFASSKSSGAPLTIRSAGGQLRRVNMETPQPAWFTEAVFAVGRAYLLDAANNQLIVLNVAQGKIERRFATPGGAAGLAVEDGRVFVKTASSGELLVFGGPNDAATTRRILAKAAPMPEAECMDAVLHVGNRLWATSHSTGQVFVLSADGGQLLDTYAVGGAPVGLEQWSGGVLVLDVQGRLLELAEDGQIRRTLKLKGNPDKFSVMDGKAYLTDRGGTVSVVDLQTFRVTRQRTFGTPMDIAALPDGHLALADATRGLLMLMPDLSDV
ncbi:zf-HC2 domain-containing protein [Deinococcus sp. QL22]|uniref:zf-HC2 domain-containing protein n=1 Tax=Deinococcus sp. QL22 TaxID=2939437 RepID=UPI00201705C7|nr:zf-HC2 domain-containing protein [Deinococcus sp. QL22]UQN07015.1 zf-HC2 domain-containing protein [Deinococcus sp. QL22]